LWDLKKSDVDTEEKALRISKILRDNQRIAMRCLCKIYEEGSLAFLAYLLELRHAERNVEFINLREKRFLTEYDKMVFTKRNTKYTVEQKARRLRIGFDALRSYRKKDNRHTFKVNETSINHSIKDLISYISTVDNGFQRLEGEMTQVLLTSSGIISEESLRGLARKIPTRKFNEFEHGKVILTDAMKVVAEDLANRWDDDRYVREQVDFD
jgi:hypothetical protein